MDRGDQNEAGEAGRDEVRAEAEPAVEDAAGDPRTQAAEDSGRFLVTAQLAPPVGTGTLKSGAAATLLEFVGVANCAVSGGGDIARLFKPYMQFDVAGDGRIRRNWDRAPNYLVSRQVPGFDRTGDVMR